MGAEEGEENHGDPDVLEGGGGGEEGERTREAADGVGPDQGTVPAGKQHEGAGEDEPFCFYGVSFGEARQVGWWEEGGQSCRRTCGPVEVPEIQRVRVVGLPGGEEHREAGYQGREGADSRVPETHCRYFA